MKPDKTIKMRLILNIKTALEEICNAKDPEIADRARRKIEATSNVLWRRFRNDGPAL